MNIMGVNCMGPLVDRFFPYLYYPVYHARLFEFTNGEPWIQRADCKAIQRFLRDVGTPDLPVLFKDQLSVRS